MPPDPVVDSGPPVRVRQGVVEAWDPASGNNTIRVAGGKLVNITASKAGAAAMKVGDVVLLLSAGNKWYLLGTATTPGDPGTVPTWNADISALAPLTTLAALTDGTTITGATVAAADTGARAVLNDPAYPGELVFYSGKAGELVPARVRGNLGGNYGFLELRSPDIGAAGGYSFIELDGFDDGTATAALEAGTSVRVSSDLLRLQGWSAVQIGSDIEFFTVVGNNIAGADLSDASNVLPANPQPVTVSEATDQLSQTSTTFVAGSPQCGVAFIAPPTGKVYITVSGRIQNETASNNSYLGYEVRTGALVGSGAIVTGGAASDSNALVVGGNATGLTFARVGGSKRALLTGLTPGTSYNVRTMHRSQNVGGVTTVFDRELLVEPVL